MLAHGRGNTALIGLVLQGQVIPCHDIRHQMNHAQCGCFAQLMRAAAIACGMQSMQSYLLLLLLLDQTFVAYRGGVTILLAWRFRRHAL